MKNHACALLASLLICADISFGFAQNLVNNGGFETYSSLPTGAAQWNLCTGWSNCSGSGSPDYGHTNGTGLAQLPNNYFATVSPYSGNAIMGFILWHSVGNFREYISTSLTTPLIAGQPYDVSFYITNGVSNGNYGGWACDQVSIAFSVGPLVQTGSGFIPVTPHYTYPGILQDTSWHLVSFTFTPAQSYTYITIGNFVDDASTGLTQFTSTPFNAAYYFADDISVEPDSSGIPVASLASSDTTFCEKQCINFFDLSLNSPTSWQWYFPGASPDTSTLQNPSAICYLLYGTYDIILVTCNAAGCDSLFLPGFITVYQTPTSPVIIQSNDTLFCSPAFSYAWYEVSSPSTILSADSFFVIPQNGSYYVVVSDTNGCQEASNIVIVNVGIGEFKDQHEPELSPNPASNSITISFSKNISSSELKILDLLGRQKMQTILSGSNSSIDISGLSDGIYFAEIRSGENVSVRKFVKQQP